ncbi:RmlC-like cupin [Ceratobasidium sp. AG-I]|nr:RmlC-like cupin [Ceratobasidium sp. AG-I]
MATQSLSRTVAKKVYAVETPEGAGAVVRRSIGSMNLRNLSLFLMLDHSRVTPGSGFPDHPHRGQATVSYMIEVDDCGQSNRTLRMPLFGPDDSYCEGVQLWVDLPKEHKMTEPSDQELKRSQIPSAFPEGPDGPIEVKVISGKSFGVESPVKHLGGCWYMDFQFKASNVTVFQDLPAGWTAFLYILNDSLKVDNSQSHNHFHILVSFSPLTFYLKARPPPKVL